MFQNPGSLLLDKLPTSHILAVSDLDSEGSEEREGEGNRNRPESWKLVTGQASDHSHTGCERPGLGGE
jgi:hypothetical protein